MPDEKDDLTTSAEACKEVLRDLITTCNKEQLEQAAEQMKDKK